jgi:hypothetical protein
MKSFEAGTFPRISPFDQWQNVSAITKVKRCISDMFNTHHHPLNLHTKRRASGWRGS